MTTDTKLLPCPFCGGPAERLDFGPGDAGNEGGSCITCTQCLASGPVEFGRKETFIANWNDRAKDAEIEALRAEVAFKAALVSELLPYQDRAVIAEARAERLAEALRLIAAPMRPDGTWNRGRESCRQIAEEALRDHEQEVGNG